MAWEVSIVSVTQDATDGVARVVFSLTDGVETVEKTERISDVLRIREIARLHVEHMEAKARLKAEIASPTTGVVSFTPPPPTAEQVDFSAFQNKLNKYRQMKKAFDLGLETQAEVDTAHAALVTAYRRKHLDLL